MKIDHDNKAIWMNESTPDEIMLKLKKYNCISKLVEMSKISGKYGMPINQNDREWSNIASAVFKGYEIKSESNKKYYWRKKKEYQTKYEQEHSYGYLVKGISVPYIISGYGSTFTYTEQEARDLLKDDFDKFEKVECE